MFHEYGLPLLPLKCVHWSNIMENKQKIPVHRARNFDMTSLSKTGAVLICIESFGTETSQPVHVTRWCPFGRLNNKACLDTALRWMQAIQDGFISAMFTFRPDKPHHADEMAALLILTR